MKSTALIFLIFSVTLMGCISISQGGFSFERGDIVQVEPDDYNAYVTPGRFVFLRFEISREYSDIFSDAHVHDRQITLYNCDNPDRAIEFVIIPDGWDVFPIAIHRERAIEMLIRPSMIEEISTSQDSGDLNFCASIAVRSNAMLLRRSNEVEIVVRNGR